MVWQHRRWDGQQDKAALEVGQVLVAKGKTGSSDKTNPAGGQGQSSKAASLRWVIVVLLWLIRVMVGLLLGLEVTLAQRYVAWPGSGNLTAYTKRNLLDFAAACQELGGLFFDGHAGEIFSRRYNGFAFTGFCSSHGDPWSQSI
jgi:hypothetical protein